MTSLNPSQQAHPKPITKTGKSYEEAFFDHISKARVDAKVIGGDATGRTRPFVPIDALRGPTGFFSKDATQSLLNYYCGSNVQIQWDRVHTSFLAVFSILITIGKASYLHHFTQNLRLTDKNLPFISHESWHNDCHSFFDEFCDAQWQFSGQIFDTDWMNETRLDDLSILPIINETCLKNGPDACTYWIKLYPSYDHLHDKAHGGPTANEYLLKTCKREHAKYHFNEVGAYRILSKCNEFRPYLPRFYGSWTIGNTYYMLLEYVEGGNLTQYMANTDAPGGPEELMQFWSSLLKVSIPVMWIHSVPLIDQNPLDLRGIHHDIKTDNILVKFNVNTSHLTGSPPDYNISLKLADLGLTDIMSFDEEKMTAIGDKPGTQTYSAPENFVEEENEIHCRTARPAYPSKDIWALACVFSQALVWSVLGPKGLADYQEARASAISLIPKLKCSAYSECFHDGVRALEAVSYYHEKAFRSKRHFDELVRPVQMLVQMMLRPHKTRINAEQVWATASDILKGARETLYPEFWRTGSPSPDIQATVPRLYPVTNTTGLGMKGINTSAEMHSTVTNYANPQSTRKIIPSPSEPPYRMTPPELPTGKPGSMMALPAENPTPGPCAKTASFARALPQDPTPQPWSSYPGPYRYTIHEDRNAVKNVRTPSKDVHHDVRRHTMTGAVQDTVEPKVGKGHTTVSGHSSPTIPAMSIDEVITWIGQTKKDKTIPLPHGADGWLNKLSARDQIFLIEDAETMRPYWDDVQKAFRALGYIAKRSDYDGMDLHFTNNTSVNRCAKHRAPLMSTLKGIQLGGKCDIGLSFGKIVRGIKLDSEKQGKRHSFTQRFRNKTKWGTSIYVFTSGMWEQECDWLHGIVDPLKELMGRNVMRGEVGVQFIQFGNDALATARLKKLDDQLDGHGVQRDMVDTTHADGNVFKMLLGSFNPSWDNCETP